MPLLVARIKGRLYAHAAALSRVGAYVATEEAIDRLLTELKAFDRLREATSLMLAVLGLVIASSRRKRAGSTPPRLLTPS